MDITTAFGVPVIKVIDGTTHSFPKLSLPDIASIFAKVKAEKIDQTERTVAKAKLTGMDAFTILSESEGWEAPFGYIYALAESPRWAEAMLRVSLAKATKTEAEATQTISSIDPDQLITVALQVVGYKPKPQPPVEPKSDEKKAGADPKNPKTPDEARGFGDK